MDPDKHPRYVLPKSISNFLFNSFMAKDQKVRPKSYPQHIRINLQITIVLPCLLPFDSPFLNPEIPIDTPLGFRV